MLLSLVLKDLEIHRFDSEWENFQRVCLSLLQRMLRKCSLSSKFVLRTAFRTQYHLSNRGGGIGMWQMTEFDVGAYNGVGGRQFDLCRRYINHDYYGNSTVCTGIKAKNVI